MIDAPQTMTTPKADPEIRIERARPEDGPALQALQRRCTHSATFDVEKFNHPDFFGRSRVYERACVSVARAGGTIVGSQAGGVRELLLDGELRKVGYMFQLFVAPEAQGQGVAGKLRKATMAFFAEQGCALAYTIVADGNQRSTRFAAKSGDLPTRSLTMASLPVYRSMSRPRAGVSVRPFTPMDARAVAALANRTWAGHQMFEPLTADKLVADLERVPGTGLDSLVVLEEAGTIRACAGFWNASEIERVTMRSLSPRLQATALALDLARLLRKTPRVPRPGETLRQWMLVPLGWERIGELAELFAALNDRALAEDIGQLFLLAEANHPVFAALDGFFKIEVGLRLLVTPIAAGAALGPGPLHVAATDQ